MATIDLYAELGVAREANAVDIRRAYRRRAKHAHPDAGGSPGQRGFYGSFGA